MCLFAEIIARMDGDKIDPIMIFRPVLNSNKCQKANIWPYFAEKAGHKMRRVVFDAGCVTEENVNAVLGGMKGLESLSVEGGSGKGGVTLGGVMREVGGMKLLRRLELKRLEVGGEGGGLEALLEGLGDQLEFLTLNVRFVDFYFLI